MPARCSPVGVLKAVSSWSSLRCVTWGSLGSSSPVSESGECGEGEQEVRGHGDNRPGWRCPLQTHCLQGQESSARGAAGGGSTGAGALSTTCRDKLPAGKGRTWDEKVQQGRSRQGRAGKMDRSSVR